MAFVDFDVFWSENHVQHNKSRFLFVYFLVLCRSDRWIYFIPGIWSPNVCFWLTSSAVGLTAYAGSYGDSVTTRFSHEVKPVKPRNTRSKLELKTRDGGKNTQMDSNRGIYNFNPIESATGQTEIDRTTTTGHEDLPELYILVLVSYFYVVFVLFRWQLHKCIRHNGGDLFYFWDGVSEHTTIFFYSQESVDRRFCFQTTRYSCLFRGEL